MTGPRPLAELTMRAFEHEADYWRFREALRQWMLRNARRERSWHVARLDYWWWFANPDLEHLDPRSHLFLWEADGELVAAIGPEGPGQVHLQIDPWSRTGELEAAMLEVAEARLAVARPDGRRRLWAYADSMDPARQAILVQRGYRRVTRAGAAETHHRRRLDRPVPAVPRIAGYEIRPLGGGLELLERCYASGLAFHDDDIAVARDNRDHPAWYHHIQMAPLYRRDLDIVAVAADGSVAAFCTAWFDDVTLTAYLEPVATVPAHRRRGLARAVILEALHRLQRMGCRVAFVGANSEAANALYSAVMGRDQDVIEPWEWLGSG